MFIINLWEWVFNFVAVGIGLLSYGVALCIFALLLNVVYTGIRSLYVRYNGKYNSQS